MTAHQPEPIIHVRPLTAEDAHAYHALRREMLADAPWAFSSSPQDDRMRTIEGVLESITAPGHAIIGALAGPELIASAGVFRAKQAKAAHLATIWGVYVKPEFRGQALAAQVVAEAIRTARTWPGILAVGLSVSARAPAARRTYERLGFIAWGVEPAATRLGDELIDEVHMQLTL